MVRMASRVYVIELDRAAGARRDPRIPWVYVGSSARDPRIRFDQHRRGYKSSGLVRRFAVRLRPDLYDDLAPFARSSDARDAELARALELARCGFVAHCDGTSHGRNAGNWAEWDSRRLEPVLGHLDAAAAELAASAFQPLEPGTCARLLHGERGFWVADHLDPNDPPPAYGLFAHVRLEVLRCRVEGLAESGAPRRAARRLDRVGAPSWAAM